MIRNQFNVRVYGILINEKDEVLVTIEKRFGYLITKFPGGGLEFGEGTIDCLKREFLEETGIEVTVKNHFYTTDFYQQSAFDKLQQVISIYYTVESNFNHEILTSYSEVTNLAEDGQIFRWIPIKELKIDDFTFPIDKKVAGMIID